MIEIKFTESITGNQKTVVYLIEQNLNLSSHLIGINNQTKGFVSNVIKASPNFEGKFGQVKIIPTQLNENEICQIILIGVGNISELNVIKIENLGGKIYRTLESLRAEEASIITINDIQATDLAFGFLLASYTFDKYKTQVEEPTKFIKTCQFLVKDQANAEIEFESKKNLQQAIFLTRDFVNEVPNVLNTDAYTDLIIKYLTGLNVEVEVLGELEMEKLGMNALLGVGKGSSSESKLVVMKYNGLDNTTAPVALVGKGVVFDTGGISLKPSSGMHEMKYDMAGSASVFGTIRALASNQVKVNAVGVMALVENMPDGNAQRPGDVVKTMSGQTAEVLDTDAEGRLVLADALWYTQLNFTPSIIIDLATLTGAIVVALGNTFAGCFSNNDELAERLIASGNKVNEKLWRMPMHDDYDKMIKSEVADWANIGSGRGTAGSAMGAHFLEKFVNKLPWAHLDIAGVAWEKKGQDICPKGATAFGVRLLTQLIQDYYVQK